MFLIKGFDGPIDSTFIWLIPERFRLDTVQVLPSIEILIKTIVLGDTAVAIIVSVHALEPAQVFDLEKGER